MPYHNSLTPVHSDKIARGTKAERTHHIITHNPNTAQPGETLYIRCPKLQTGVVLVPDTFDLVFDLEIMGDATNRVVQNVAKNIVSQLLLKFENETLFDLSNYNIIECYRDLYNHKKDRMNMTLYGIQTENMRKLRSGAADADESAKDDMLLYDVYKNTFAIRLNHPMVTSHGAVYPSSLGSHIEWEVTLAPPKQLLVTKNLATANYRLNNIRLEYETIRDSNLAQDIAGYYNNCKSFLYEHVHHFRTIPFKESDTIINENINIPRRSIRGLVLLFTKSQDQDRLNSELYINPKISSVSITIEGIANKIYAQGMEPRHFWREACRYFMEDKALCATDMDETDFLKNKFCLFIDLRSFKNSEYHGNGLRVINTKDGVQLEIRKNNTSVTEGADDEKHDYRMYAHLYVLSDAMMSVEGAKLQSVQY